MPLLVTSAYLPPAAYMAEVVKADDLVVENSETYIKQTCRSHCTICGPNGMQTLSIPVIRVNGNHTLIRDIRISDHQPWQRIHWRSIETAYNNSPFFLYYQDYFIPVFEKKFRFLADHNTALLEILLRIFGTGCTIRYSDKYEAVPGGARDFRNRWISKHDSHPQQPRYTQVFEYRHGFIPGLSILDALFNLGPETGGYLASLAQGSSGLSR